jgi:hypothetical protein
MRSRVSIFFLRKARQAIEEPLLKSRFFLLPVFHADPLFAF